MIIERKCPDLSLFNAKQSNITTGYWKTLYTLPNGRILAGSDDAPGNGILYSDDKGKHWTQSNITSDGWFAFCVTQTGRVIAGGKNDIAYSDDNGEHWTLLNMSHAGNWYSWYALCISHTGRIFAAGGDIWYSDDNGEHWTSCNTEKPWLSICVTHSGRIIAGGGGSIQLNYGVWYSDDNGVTWSQNTILYNGVWPALCVTPTGRILTRYGLYSDDDGDTWSQASVAGDWQYFCIIPTQTYAGEAVQNIIMANFYCSFDDGITWLDLIDDFDKPIYIRGITKDNNTIIIGSQGIYYVDPVVKIEETSFVDKTGVQEIVTQAKAYIDNL